MTRFKKAGYFLEGMAMGCSIFGSCQIKKVLLIKPIQDHTMYGIFTYIWLFLIVKYGFHVGKYTSPMDA